MPLRAVSFVGLTAASPRATYLARSASSKTDTRCELVLRRVLRNRGHRFVANCNRLPGRPDLVFPKERLVVFCDGDFWHGRNIAERSQKLAKGHNAAYWLRKIATNVARDRLVTARLRRRGWSVLRVWETDIVQAPERIADLITRKLAARERAVKNSASS